MAAMKSASQSSNSEARRGTEKRHSTRNARTNTLINVVSGLGVTEL
jgi:hypothetical protein